jgi:hypothetical protein
MVRGSPAVGIAVTSTLLEINKTALGERYAQLHVRPKLALHFGCHILHYFRRSAV